jgi:hypothetical protein
MKLYFDLDTSRLIAHEGCNSALEKLEAKRGEGARIELVLLKEGARWQAPSLSQFRFIVKPTGKYAVEETCALATSWTFDSTRTSYTAKINFVTTKLNGLLRIADAAGENKTTEMTLDAEFAMRESDGEPWADRSFTVPFVLHNNLWRGTEVVPGSLTSEEGTGVLLLTPVLSSLVANVINNEAGGNVLKDTGLQFEVEAGKLYSFEARLFYNSASTTNGARFTISTPTTTVLSYSAEWTLTATTRSVNANSTQNLPSSSGATSLTSGNMAEVKGLVKPSANGTVKVRFASELADTAITVLQGSHLTYMVLPTE